jgi:hypothetical protein
LPKDATEMVDIYISKPSPDMVRNIVGQLAKNQASADAVLLKRLEEQSKRAYDSIVVLFRKNSFEETRLANGRLEFLPLISGALNQYLNEARDANDAFLSLSSSFEKKAAYDQYAEAIYNYGQIYELLNTNKSTYEQAVYTYWNSKELSLKFSNLIDFALEDIHKSYFLDLNYSFHNRINEMMKEKYQRRRLELQKTLSKEMKEHSATVSRRLNTLGERTAAFITLINSDLQVNN